MWLRGWWRCGWEDGGGVTGRMVEGVAGMHVVR